MSEHVTTDGSPRQRTEMSFVDLEHSYSPVTEPGSAVKLPSIDIEEGLDDENTRHEFTLQPFSPSPSEFAMGNEVPPAEIDIRPHADAPAGPNSDETQTIHGDRKTQREAVRDFLRGFLRTAPHKTWGEMNPADTKPDRLKNRIDVRLDPKSITAEMV